MTEPYGIALIGCGTVGSGVAKLLIEHADRLAARAGRRLELRHIVVRDVGKPRPTASRSTSSPPICAACWRTPACRRRSKWSAASIGPSAPCSTCWRPANMW